MEAVDPAPSLFVHMTHHDDRWVMAMTTDSRVLGALRLAARRVGDEPDSTVDSDLRWIVCCAVDTVAPAVGGGITRTSEGTVRSAYTTGEDIDHLDRLQSDLQQGPCVSAADGSSARDGVIHARDLAAADHDVWPAFAPQAVALGYRSMLSLRLSSEPGHDSALNLYAHRPHVFDDAAVFTATAFSLQAGVLLHGERRAENLRRALETRDLISQAKGVLMERFNLSGERAFRLLVTVSQESHVKLAEVARWLLTDADRAIKRPDPAPVTSRPGTPADRDPLTGRGRRHARPS